jgi:hypothetical protein
LKRDPAEVHEGDRRRAKQTGSTTDFKFTAIRGLRTHELAAVEQRRPERRERLGLEVGPKTATQRDRALREGDCLCAAAGDGRDVRLPTQGIRDGADVA